MVLDDFVPADHVCRVIDSFFEKLVMSELGFEQAQALRPLRQDDLAQSAALDRIWPFVNNPRAIDLSP
jgi:hypothetical protein